MKRFIYVVITFIFIYILCDSAFYRWGWYVDIHPDVKVSTFTTTDEKEIYVDTGKGMQPYTIKGVNMGVGIPGHWATDYAISKKTYLRWFRQIQDMGANTIRVYTILQDDFYNAFYEYNRNNETPLYLIHGVWVNDYVMNSHRDAYDSDFIDVLIEDCRTVVDLLHGNKKLSLGVGLGSGSYRKDISQWVLGYIVGIEWEDLTVAYTDHKYPEMKPYEGVYVTATEEATPFESMLAQVGDKLVEYESKRYKQQRLLAFSNWPTTDPFLYPKDITAYFMKCAQVNVEHIKTTENMLSGQFASYHVYPYYPDYLNYIIHKAESPDEEHSRDGMADTGPGIPIETLLNCNDKEEFLDSEGNTNTYIAYLRMLTRHHNMPVVISEFGVSTGRGMAHRDYNTKRNQGQMSEGEQGEALVKCWEDIMEAGCNGGCIFTWQDEWFKRTWNTMHAVDLTKTPYWSDYQTNEQYFGLLSFDPGKEKSVCYVDGELSEWSKEDEIFKDEKSSLSVKYDEKFLYFMIYQKGFEEGQFPLYIPFDITPKSGSDFCENPAVEFERDCDFLMILDGKENSRILVQKRYEVLRAMFHHETTNRDAYVNVPDVDTPVFKKIQMILQTATSLLTGQEEASAETYETGKLLYGNANPDSEDFNSLADFIFSGDYVEVKIPWQLLNFSDPSNMRIHDDYYEHYGVENLDIDRIYAGIGTGETRIPMEEIKLKPWKKKVTYHERLKESYYVMKELWNEENRNDYIAEQEVSRR